MPRTLSRVSGYPVLFLIAGLTAGCGDAPLEVLPIGVPEVTQLRDAAPPGAPEGTCWGRDNTPAVIETVTEHTLVEPEETAPDGTVISPAVYATETHQAIVRERNEVWFRTPCAAELTPDFVSSLQRALQVRGIYQGPINGKMDEPTRRAIHDYQQPEGLDSGVLSLAIARKLGLAVIEVPGVSDTETIEVPVPAGTTAQDASAAPVEG